MGHREEAHKIYRGIPINASALASEAAWVRAPGWAGISAEIHAGAAVALCPGEILTKFAYDYIERIAGEGVGEWGRDGGEECACGAARYIAWGEDGAAHLGILAAISHFSCARRCWASRIRALVSSDLGFPLVASEIFSFVSGLILVPLSLLGSLIFFLGSSIFGLAAFAR